MTTTIVLEVDGAPGFLVRVTSALRRLGLRVASQGLGDGIGGNRRLTLEVDGDELPEALLRERLEPVGGVLGVLEIRYGKAPARRPTSRPANAAAAHEETVGGDVEIRDQLLIGSLETQFPRILGRLREIRAATPPDERSQRLEVLGRGLGRRLARRAKRPIHGNDLASALREVVVPMLRPLVELTLSERGGGVPPALQHAAARSLEGATADDQPCYFTQGLLRGLLEGIPAAGRCGVRESRCINLGDRCCEFVIEPA